MFENNYIKLCDVINNDRAIRNISKHRNPDGSLDIIGNLKIWDDLLEEFEIIKLWDKTPNYKVDTYPKQPEPSMIFVPAQNISEKRGTIVVCHGGGFETRTGCEGFNIAKYFCDAGFNCAILTYRVKPYSRQDALDDIDRCVKLLRHKKNELNITDKIACMGFSAGGMLSANLATHFNLGRDDLDEVEKESSRPDACVLGYGAFCFAAQYQGFFMDPFSEQIRNPFFKDRNDLVYFSPEVNITRQTPPFFIWQTNSDDPRNAFTFGQALTACGVKFEMHLFPEGQHGLALADGHNDLALNIPHVTKWADMCADWLKDQGI